MDANISSALNMPNTLRGENEEGQTMKPTTEVLSQSTPMKTSTSHGQGGLWDQNVEMDPDEDPTLLSSILEDLNHHIYKPPRTSSDGDADDEAANVYTVSEQDPSWLIHEDHSWLYNPSQSIYLHVLTRSCFTEEIPGSNQFIPIPITRVTNSPESTADESGNFECSPLNVERSRDDAQNDRPDNEDEKDAGGELDLNDALRCGVFTKKGPMKSESQDRYVMKEAIPLDALGIETDACCYFFGIFDGHAGHTCAEYCTQHLRNNLMSMMRQMRRPSSEEIASSHFAEGEWLKKCLKKAFQQTDKNYLDYSSKQGLTDGSTGLVVLLYGPDGRGELKIVTAHCGDSRAILCRDGKLKELTKDHKPDNEDERQRVRAAGGRVMKVENVWRVVTTVGGQTIGLATSRSFGDVLLKRPKHLITSEPEIRLFNVQFQRDSFMVLATDGIYDAVPAEEVITFVRSLSTGNPSKAARRLVELSEERDHPDDKTALVVFFGWNSDVLEDEGDQDQDGEGDSRAGASREKDDGADDDDADRSEQRESDPPVDGPSKLDGRNPLKRGAQHLGPSSGSPSSSQHLEPPAKELKLTTTTTTTSLLTSSSSSALIETSQEGEDDTIEDMFAG